MNSVLFRLAFRNLFRRFRKNFVVGILVAVGVAVFFLGNTLIDSSLQGINRSFVQNFTGDMSVSATSDEHFGIFGPDVPVISAYQQTPLLPGPEVLYDTIRATPGIEKVAPIVSFPLAIDMQGYRSGALGIGTIAREYFELFSSVKFVRGAPPVSDERPWVVIPETRVVQMESDLGHPLAVGDSIILSMAHNSTFTIREAIFAGSIVYEPENESLTKTILLDGKTLRDLSGLAQTSLHETQREDESPVPTSESIDDLFGDATDTLIQNSSSGLNVNEVAKSIASQKIALPEAPLDHTGAWHFILIRTAKGADVPAIGKLLRSKLETGASPVDVRDWRDTAGIAASYVYALQALFYVALSMLGGIIIMITINSLVVSVIERSSEIGTMRAIGAQRSFVRKLFIVEIMVLCAISAIVGVVLGLCGLVFINSLNVSISNEILALLFGGTKLHLVFSSFSIVSALLAALFVGAVAWIHPVRMALRIQPVHAMHMQQ